MKFSFPNADTTTYFQINIIDLFIVSPVDYLETFTASSKMNLELDHILFSFWQYEHGRCSNHILSCAVRHRDVGLKITLLEYIEYFGRF